MCLQALNQSQNVTTNNDVLIPLQVVSVLRCGYRHILKYAPPLPHSSPISARKAQLNPPTVDGLSEESGGAQVKCSPAAPALIV